MNLLEARDAMLKVRQALEIAIGGEASAARRSRLRSLVLKLEHELAVVDCRIMLDGSAGYEPVRDNFVTAVKDLHWARNMADTFAISRAEAASIVSWVASIRQLL
jgi:hypothetical protein